MVEIEGHRLDVKGAMSRLLILSYIVGFRYFYPVPSNSATQSRMLRHSYFNIGMQEELLVNNFPTTGLWL